MHMLLLAVACVFCSSTVTAVNNGSFPSNFLFGVGTSAYQTEGAWDEDGKGENIWDRWIHTNASRIANNDTADVACNSYHLYMADVLCAWVMYMEHYQFSISWSRILPNGNDTNEQGILYYKELIAAIIQYEMIPVATLYHHDLPQALQDIGGWLNPEMVNYFAKYARTAFQNFDNVGYWLTFNGPRSTCRLGHGDGQHAPGIAIDGIAEYVCAYVVVKSHAEAYHVYKTEFPNLTAKMSIAIDLDWSEPASNSAFDVEAAERRNLFEFGLYAHPIYKGNWPQTVIERVAERSRNENLTGSRLPVFTQEDIDYINGTFDFMGVNMFTTNLAADVAEPEYGDPGYLKDMRAETSIHPDWIVSTAGKAIVPWGARNTLVWLKDTYNNPEILITGNGVSNFENESSGTMELDYGRIAFIRDYLDAILDAMYEDGVNVFGYTVWSLLDSFEWTEGYSQPYGLFHVNRSSSNRYPKYSSILYADIARTHQIPDSATTSAITTTTPSTTTGSASKTSMYPLLILTAPIFYCIRL